MRNEELQDCGRDGYDMFRDAPVGVFHSSPSGKLLSANPALAVMLRYDSPDDLIAEVNRSNIADRLYVDPSRRAEFIDILSTADGWRTLQGEFRRKDGSILITEMKVRALFAENGEIEQIVGFIEDATEKKAARDALISSELRYRELYSNALVALYRIRISDGRVLECNQRFAELYGYRDVEHVRADYDVNDHYLDPEDRIAVIGELARTGQVRMFLIHQRKLDGTEMWIRTSSRAHLKEGFVEGMSIDVTEQIKVEEERQRLQDHVLRAQKAETIGMLAGGVAHHFNNLMQAVMGNADMALMDIPPESAIRTHLNEILMASRRAAVLSNQMLAYAGQGHFRDEEVELAGLLRSLEASMFTSVTDNAQLDIVLSNEPIIIRGDSAQIKQIVMALLANASEALGEGPGRIEVTSGTYRCTPDFISETFSSEDVPEGDYAFITVSDTGPGMDRETISKIFDPFFSTKYVGRGLGLAAVLGIVRAHGGMVHVESTPGEGSRFTVYFRKAHGSGEDEDALVGGAPSVAVLLVDDEQRVLEVAGDMIGRLGYEAITARSGQQAVQLLRDRGSGISLILLDVIMGGVPCKTTVGAIRNVDPNVPIVLVSGYVSENIIETLGLKDISGFMSKPFSMGSLRNTLREALA